MISLPAEIVVEDLSTYRSDWTPMAFIRERRGDPLPPPAAAVRPAPP